MFTWFPTKLHHSHVMLNLVWGKLEALQWTWCFSYVVPRAMHFLSNHQKGMVLTCFGWLIIYVWASTWDTWNPFLGIIQQTCHLMLAGGHLVCWFDLSCLACFVWLVRWWVWPLGSTLVVVCIVWYFCKLDSVHNFVLTCFLIEWQSTTAARRFLTHFSLGIIKLIVVEGHLTGVSCCY